MTSGSYERVLETLEDLDARLAGLEVDYSETNASAARSLVADLAECFETEPEEFVALREAVETLDETQDSSHAAAAKEHADALERRIQDRADDE